MNAVVLQLPAKVQRATKRRLNRVEVEARYRWAREHSEKWETDETDGTMPPKYLNPQCRQLLKLMDERWGVIKGPSMKEMRRYVAESRKRIDKRNQAKAWLRSLGADLDTITTSEQALFFALGQLA